MTRSQVLFTAVLVLLLPAAAWNVPLPPAILHPPRSHARGAARSRAAQARWASAAPSAGREFSPVDYGGDPTGAADSTTAVAAAVTALLAACAPAAPREPERDCGGASLDLQGGEYLISAPTVIPAGVANLRVTQGTLRASPTFPRDRYLLEVGNTTAGGGATDVDISALFLDAYQRAAGCILTNGVTGGIIGPQVYAFNFTAYGIRVVGGFEVTITQSWAAEYWWSDPRKENGTASTAVGIYKEGNDGAIVDVIVYSSRVGVQVNGEANILDSIHTWSLANGNGGIGILVNTSQARLVSCYMDWQDVVFVNPLMVSFIGGFFLCGARIRLVAPPNGEARGIYIADNQFISDYCHFSGYAAVEADGPFTAASDVTVVGTLAQPQIGVRSTAATAVVTSAVPTTTFTANFTDALLFDVARVPIKSVTYSLTLASGVAVVAHAARPPVGGVVTVELAAPAAGAVTITVDQSDRRSGA